MRNGWIQTYWYNTTIQIPKDGLARRNSQIGWEDWVRVTGNKNQVHHLTPHQNHSRHHWDPSATQVQTNARSHSQLDQRPLNPQLKSIQSTHHPELFRKNSRRPRSSVTIWSHWFFQRAKIFPPLPKRQTRCMKSSWYSNTLTSSKAWSRVCSLCTPKPQPSHRCRRRTYL